MNNIKQTIKRNDREFKLALVTKDFIFYIDENESDENGNAIMYRNNKDMELISDNYFAYCGLMEEIDELEEGKEIIFESESIKDYRENR